MSPRLIDTIHMYQGDIGLGCVREFQEVFGAHIGAKPEVPDESGGFVHTALACYHQEAKRLGERLKEASRDSGIPGGSLLLIRLQLIQEELAELAAAFIARDIVETLDALGDLSYVVDGTYLTTGLAPFKLAAIREIHRSNMTKLGEDGKPILSDAGRVVKGPNYERPDLAALLKEHV